MRPITLSTVTPFTSRESSPRVQNQPAPSPIRHLRDIDLKTLDKPYTNEQIAKYLNEHSVPTTGEPIFDDCLFQSVHFTDFFEKIETGYFEQRETEEVQSQYDRSAQYFLKKSVELLQPLGIKIEDSLQRYDELLSSLSTASCERLNKQLPLFQNMKAKFEAIERNLLHARTDFQSFRPTRDKACFLLFVHALLSDAVDEMRWLMNAVVADQPHIPWDMPIEGDSSTLEAYLTNQETHSDLFSPGPLTQADATLYKQCLKIELDVVGAKAATVPSFSPTGSQGVLAILHAIFNGKSLLSGATRRPLAVHNNIYMQRHFPTLRHDCAHLELLLEYRVLSSTARQLKPIYWKLREPGSGMSLEKVKEDLVVLLYMLHENYLLMEVLSGSYASEATFLDFATEYSRDVEATADMVTLLNELGLNELGLTIAPIHEKSTAEEIAASCEGFAKAMDRLWKGFRGRHATELRASELFARLPKFLTD